MPPLGVMLTIVPAIMILDGLLSVDNALINASLAAHLPPKQRQQAIIFGLAAGAGLRVIALLFVGFIMAWPALKLVGGAYLGYLCVKHFLSQVGEEDEHVKKAQGSFASVIGAIAMADLAFSVDNVVASVGMSSYMLVVIIGVLASVIVMMGATQIVVWLLKRFPTMEHAAYLIIGLVALAIFLEDFHHVSEWVGISFPEIHISHVIKFGATIAVVAAAMLFDANRSGRAKRAEAAQAHPASID